MKSFVTKPLNVLFMTLLALFFSFVILQRPNFEIAPGQTFTNTISAVVVPHHDLAADLRQKVLFQAAETIYPKTIILVSPNHFDSGSYDILATDKSWRLLNASIDADKTVISKLKIPLEESAFSREHGITNLLEPVNKAFPDAKIVPIILKSGQPKAQIAQLVGNLNDVCQNQCLMVSSVDFSHYQPGSLAEIHDLFSIKTLKSLNDEKIWQTEVDSHETLALTLAWAKLHKTQKFVLKENTNSGKIENSPDAESTSYVLGWFERGVKQSPEITTFIAGHNLGKVTDKRFTAGVDQEINLADEKKMALLCHGQSHFCGLNLIFWNSPFWRETQSGLMVAGSIEGGKYHLVLIPSDGEGNLLKGEAKLTVINRVRKWLNMPEILIGYGYDTIDINR